MKTFVEITHSLNKERVMGKALVRVADIVGIKEEEPQVEQLFDSNGNVASETPKAKLFAVLVAHSESCSKTILYVEENEYQNLVALLTNE